MNPDPNEDTEWNDILRAHGIIPAKNEATEEQLNEIIDQSIQEHIDRQTNLKYKSLDELDELEDEEDDRVLNEYRAQRMAEMRAAASKEKFGDLVQISKPEFVQEVTEASNESWVVVHLFQDYIPACKLMNAHLATLANRYKAIKFIKIIANQCIKDYPDRNVPTILVYKDTNVMANWVGAIQFGGMNMTLESLRKKFVALGTLPKEKQDIEEDDDKPKKSIYKSNPATAALSDDEDDDDYN